MIYVIATTEVHDGCKEKFLEIFRAMVPKVQAEKGCISYQPNVDFASGLSAQQFNGNRITILECWESMDDLKAHLGASHMKQYREDVKDMVKAKTLNVVEPV